MKDVPMRTRRALQGGVAAFFLLSSLGLALLPENWIEKIFGSDPDGGDGLVELALVLVPLAIGLSLAAWLAMSVRAERRQLATASASRSGTDDA